MALPGFPKKLLWVNSSLKCFKAGQPVFVLAKQPLHATFSSLTLYSIQYSAITSTFRTCILRLSRKLPGQCHFLYLSELSLSSWLIRQSNQSIRDTSLGGFNPKKHHLRIIIPWLPFHPIIPFPCLKMKHPFKHIMRNMKIKHCPIIPSSHFIYLNMFSACWPSENHLRNIGGTSRTAIFSCSSMTSSKSSETSSNIGTQENYIKINIWNQKHKKGL